MSASGSRGAGHPPLGVLALANEAAEAVGRPAAPLVLVAVDHDLAFAPFISSCSLDDQIDAAFNRRPHSLQVNIR